MTGGDVAETQLRSLHVLYILTMSFFAITLKDIKETLYGRNKRH